MEFGDKLCRRKLKMAERKFDKIEEHNVLIKSGKILK
jgi:hypothetical protein